METKFKMGWKPDVPDHRDLVYAAPPKVLKALPPIVDLREFCPPIYNQGQLGSCTANAIGAAYQFSQIKLKKPNFVPSRLFIYYNERVMEGTVNEDSGAYIRDGMKSVNKQGVCDEKIWPYDDGPSKFKKKPTATCYKEGLKNQVISYMRLSPSLNELKACLASGYPFVFGFAVYDNIFSPTVIKTGKLDLPGKNDAMQGGHAVMAVGYNDKEKRFIVRNSWGTEWGMKGYFTMPYSYVANLNYSDDFWTIRTVE